MFKKFATTVWPNGKTAVVQKTPMQRLIYEDRDYERERLSEIARGTNNILTVEETDNTIVVIYQAGKVVIYHWVDESEEV